MIKTSASAEIRQLVEALASGDDVRREAAIARLAIVGPRAVDRLVTAYEAAHDAETRIAVLRALEPLADPRTVAVARLAIARGGDEAIAAAAALRPLLDSSLAPSASAALDTLVAVTLDEDAERRLRLAAFEALQNLPSTVRNRLTPVWGQISIFSRQTQELTPMAGGGTQALWEDALDGHLPEDPSLMRQAIDQRAPRAPLTSLQKLIDLIRAREGDVRGRARRDDWRKVRGAAHQAIALRNSRIAVYDLRETLEQADGVLPSGFVSALHAVGDASCLAPLAIAYSREKNRAWRAQLHDAFRAIVRRERITKRHAVMRKVDKIAPGILGK